MRNEDTNDPEKQDSKIPGKVFINDTRGTKMLNRFIGEQERDVLLS